MIVLRGEDAVLNCSTDASTGDNPITWNYDGDIVSYSPCTSQSPGFVTSPPDSATDCNIRAVSSWKHGISGAYRCNIPRQRIRAVAMVIVLGERYVRFVLFFYISVVESGQWLDKTVKSSIANHAPPTVTVMYGHVRQAMSHTYRVSV